MMPQKNYFNHPSKEQSKQLPKFTEQDELYFRYGFQKFPKFYKKINQKNISAQQCITCNSKILSVLVNDDESFSDIQNYVDWCRSKLRMQTHKIVQSSNVASSVNQQSKLKHVKLISVGHNDKNQYQNLNIQKFSIQGHNSCLGFNNCTIEYLLIPFHNSKIRCENVKIDRLQLSGYNSYIVLSNTIVNSIEHSGLNNQFVLKKNSIIQNESGKSFKKKLE